MVSANITSWGGKGADWALARDEEILLLQETRVTAEKMETTVRAASREAGRSAILRASQTTVKGKTSSGGLGVMVKGGLCVKNVHHVGLEHYDKHRW